MSLECCLLVFVEFFRHSAVCQQSKCDRNKTVPCDRILLKQIMYVGMHKAPNKRKALINSALISGTMLNGNSHKV